MVSDHQFTEFLQMQSQVMACFLPFPIFHTQVCFCVCVCVSCVYNITNLNLCDGFLYYTNFLCYFCSWFLIYYICTDKFIGKLVSAVGHGYCIFLSSLCSFIIFYSFQPFLYTYRNKLDFLSFH